MSPRKRHPENDGLPKRWKVEHAAVFYRVPPGQEAAWDGKKKFRLGANLAEAYKKWGEGVRRCKGAQHQQLARALSVGSDADQGKADSGR